VDDARRAVLMVVLRTVSQLSFLTLAVALVDVATSVTSAPVLVEVGTKVVILRFIRPRLIKVVLIGLLLDGRKVATRRSMDRLREWQLDEDAADLAATLFSSTRVAATRR
jgi:hypothetical protein